MAKPSGQSERAGDLLERETCHWWQGDAVKEAKKRNSPTLVRLISSTRHADRAMSSATAFVSKSNRGMLRKNWSALDQMRHLMLAAPLLDGTAEVGVPIEEGRE